MCGRFNIIDDPLARLTCTLLDVDFKTQSNNNVCPSELINTVTYKNGQYVQLDANWGIKPSWSKKLLINAQAETVFQKKTFKQAFQFSRCIIPFSGWYEWQSDPQLNKKQKYLLDKQQQPLFMAAIYYKNAVSNQNNEIELVTLTTKATRECEQIHKRMPLMIEPNTIEQWLGHDISQAKNLLNYQIEGVKYQKSA